MVVESELEVPATPPRNCYESFPSADDRGSNVGLARRHEEFEFAPLPVLMSDYHIAWSFSGSTQVDDPLSGVRVFSVSDCASQPSGYDKGSGAWAISSVIR